MQCFLFIVLFVLLQLVSFPYFITDCLFIFSEVELFSLSLFMLVLVWYWHWWQVLWKLYGIKDFNIIKTFLKEKKSLYRDIYCYRDIKFVISWYKILVILPTPILKYDFYNSCNNIFGVHVSVEIGSLPWMLVIMSADSAHIKPISKTMKLHLI